MLHDEHHGLHGLHVRVRRRARGHLQRRDAERPDVSLLVIALLQRVSKFFPQCFVDLSLKQKLSYHIESRSKYKNK